MSRGSPQMEFSRQPQLDLQRLSLHFPGALLAFSTPFPSPKPRLPDGNKSHVVSSTGRRSARELLHRQPCSKTIARLTSAFLSKVRKLIQEWIQTTRHTNTTVVLGQRNPTSPFRALVSEEEGTLKGILAKPAEQGSQSPCSRKV